LKKYNLLIFALVVIFISSFIFSFALADQSHNDLGCNDLTGCHGTASCGGPGYQWYEVAECAIRCQSGGGIVCPPTF